MVKSRVVIQQQLADVTGDHVPDQVQLIGQKPMNYDSLFYEQLQLMVSDGKTGKTKTINLDRMDGYEPIMFIGDFSGNGVSDVLVTSDSGGSGGYINVVMYSFLKLEPKVLFDSESFNAISTFRVDYRDHYRVEVRSEHPIRTYWLDIHTQDPALLAKVYQKDGMLIQPFQGSVGGINGVSPVNFYRKGAWELLVTQKVIGQFNADDLGDVFTLFSGTEQGMEFLQQFLGFIGSGERK